jgi:release factor glutamine methyltransferase
MTLLELRQVWLRKGIAALDFSLLLCHVTQKTNVWLLTHPEYDLQESEYSQLIALLNRRLADEPLAYLTGYKEFFGHSFLVTKDTLIPRPDSECLLEDMLKAYSEAKEKPLACIDIGTGSGALGISLALALPKSVRVTGSDTSVPALTLAEQNKANLQAPIQFLPGSLLEPYSNDLLAQEPLFIVANLPYISETLLAEAPKSVQGYEPKSALLSENQGLAHYQALLQQMKEKLPTTSFTAWFEISPEQTDALQKDILTAFPEAHIFVGQDLSERNRFIRLATSSC